MGALNLTPQTYGLILQGRREIADELQRVETGRDPRAEHEAEAMRDMLKALDTAIAQYRAGLH